VQGVVWLSGNGIVHADADGVVTKLLVRPGSNVTPGTALIQLQDPLLTARADVLKIRVQELQFRLDRLDFSDLAKARVVQEELRLTRANLKFAQERQAALVVRSQTAGTVILPEADDLVGRFVHRGDTIAYVARFKDTVIRVIVPEADADLVRNTAEHLSVRMSGDIAHEYAAYVAREVPALSDTLPSMALSTRGGGDISLDPTDPTQKRTLAKLLQLDLKFVDSPHISRIGGRVYVRFYYGEQPLARRLYRTARQVFLRVFQI
jgi:putative peptide zinc metalloprotease protein